VNRIHLGHCLSLSLATMLFAHGAASAAGPKIFRCGPDGRIYSQAPCKDGYEVQADDQRSAEQRKAADDVAKRDEKLADKMMRERKAREAADKPVVAVIPNSAAIKAAAPAASGAVASKAAKAKKKRPPKNPAQV
jgi:hypothetical protein